MGGTAPGGGPQLEAQLTDGRVRLLQRAEQCLAARPLRRLHRGVPHVRLDCRAHALLGGRVEGGAVRRRAPWRGVAGGAGSTVRLVTLVEQGAHARPGHMAPTDIGEDGRGPLAQLLPAVAVVRAVRHGVCEEEASRVRACWAAARRWSGRGKF